MKIFLILLSGKIWLGANLTPILQHLVDDLWHGFPLNKKNNPVYNNKHKVGAGMLSLTRTARKSLTLSRHN